MPHPNPSPQGEGRAIYASLQLRRLNDSGGHSCSKDIKSKQFHICQFPVYHLFNFTSNNFI